MENRYKVIDQIIEAAILGYVVMMFLSKGETIRTGFVLGSFILWLFTLKYRTNLSVLKGTVSKLFWTYAGITLLSVIFSIDPRYSLYAYRGEMTKSIFLFPVIATVMADEKRLKRLSYVCMFTAIFISVIGYYSYIAHDLPMLKPDISLMHVYHNKFAKYINFLLPMAFVLYFTLVKSLSKVCFIVLGIIPVLALVLNTSRGGYISFISIVFMWSLYFTKRKNRNILKNSAVAVVTAVSLLAFSWYFIPDIQQRLKVSAGQLYSVNDRIDAWVAVMYGFQQRPLVGWGYGKDIFHKDEPFENSPVKERPYNRGGEPFDDPHNTFLTVLFHQGIAGIVPYVLLVATAIAVFWKGAFKTKGIRSYVLVACVSVLLGNYILHSMFSLIKFRYLAVVLGLGMAAAGTDAPPRQDRREKPGPEY